MSYGGYLTGKEEKDPTQKSVGTGTGSQNYQAGIGYAKWLKDSAYKSAEAATAESNRLADKQYQRSVIDSGSSYQKAIGAYGSNAETIASRGLSGSGYGEWLQGNAYATHRGEVQNAGAQRLAIQNEAAYKESQAKQSADASYGQFLYQSDVAYRNEQNTTYSSLYNSAASGTSIESIMQDGRWGDLTPEQQTSITNAATEYANNKATVEAEAKANASFTTALDLLGKGWEMSEVQNYLGADAWAALGDKVGQLTTAAATAKRIKAETEGKDAKGQLLSYLDLAATGAYTAEALEAIAKSLGHYDVLSATGENGNSLWSQVVSKVNGINNAQTVQNMIDSGATKEEIKNSGAYNGLSDADKGTADKLITERDETEKSEKEQRQATIDAEVEYLETRVDGNGEYMYTSLKDVESYLKSMAVPESERSEIISAWQKKNASEFIEELGEVTFERTYDTSGELPEMHIVGEPATTEDIIAGIENGLYGDNVEMVIKTFVNAYVNASAAIPVTDHNRLSKISYARGSLKRLKDALEKLRINTDVVVSAMDTVTNLVKSPRNNDKSDKSTLR